MNSNSSAAKSDGIFTKQRVGLAGVAAVAACAACCSIPMLVAAGVGGGALTTIAGYLAPGAELVVGGVVAAAVVGVAAVRNRRRVSGCGEVCAVPGADTGVLSDGDEAAGSCGCGPTRDARMVYESAKPKPGEPIVCTADLADKPTVQAQIDGYRTAFVHLVRTERFEGGFRWMFRKEAGLRERLKELAQNEHQCCQFFQFDVKDTSEHLVWETRAEEAATSVLEFYSQMPERLREEPRRGADTVALKRRATSAGLKFAAGAVLWGVAC